MITNSAIVATLHPGNVAIVCEKNDSLGITVFEILNFPTASAATR